MTKQESVEHIKNLFPQHPNLKNLDDDGIFKIYERLEKLRKEKKFNEKLGLEQLNKNSNFDFILGFLEPEELDSFLDYQREIYLNNIIKIKLLNAKIKKNFNECCKEIKNLPLSESQSFKHLIKKSVEFSQEEKNLILD